MKPEKARAIKSFLPFIIFLINIAYIELFKNHFYNIYLGQHDIINILWIFMPLPSIVLGYILVRKNNSTRIIALNIRNLIYMLLPILCMYGRIIYYKLDFIPLPLWIVNNFVELSILGGVWLGVSIGLLVQGEDKAHRKFGAIAANRDR